jgi:hypothetical protein
MDVPLILALCTPDEFINPYPALFWSATGCAVLIGLEAFIFFLTARNVHPALQGSWLDRMRKVLNNLILGAALLALVLALWLGWQSLHFVTFCTFSGYSLPYRTFQAGQAAVVVMMSLAILFFVGGLVLLASQFWLSKTMQRAC